MQQREQPSGRNLSQRAPPPHQRHVRRRRWPQRLWAEPWRRNGIYLWSPTTFKMDPGERIPNGAWNQSVVNSTRAKTKADVRVQVVTPLLFSDATLDVWRWPVSLLLRSAPRANTWMRLSQRAEPQLDLTRVCSPVTNGGKEKEGRKRRKHKANVTGYTYSIGKYTLCLELCPRPRDHHLGFTAMP